MYYNTCLLIDHITQAFQYIIQQKFYKNINSATFIFNKTKCNIQFIKKGKKQNQGHLREVGTLQHGKQQKKDVVKKKKKWCCK